MSENTPAVLRTIAVDLATRTAEKINARRAELGDLRAFVSTKSSVVDPVTVVDTAAEAFISDELERLRPADGLVGEEGNERASTSGVSWIVDPIDGTVNFLYGLPHYAVSVGAAVDGRAVAGAVVNGATGAVFSAAEGEGATVTLGGETVPLRASATVDVETTLLATGFSYSASRRAQQVEILGRLMSRVRDVRRMGSAALDLCALAAGHVDLYYEHGIHSWDYAAGVIIAREAGAVVTHPPLSVTGQEFRPVVGYAPGLAGVIDPVLEAAGVHQPLPTLPH